jgi:nicotinate phosphoribosyltransferase
VYHCTSYDAIKAGRVTDIYFARTLEILKAEGLDKRVKAEFIAKNLPEDWTWAVLAGVEEVAALADGMKVNIRAMDEGTVFRPWEPVLEIEGMYTDFCVYETAMLGLICQASGIATMAARCRLADGASSASARGGCTRSWRRSSSGTPLSAAATACRLAKGPS